MMERIGNVDGWGRRVDGRERERKKSMQRIRRTVGIGRERGRKNVERVKSTDGRGRTYLE